MSVFTNVRNVHGNRVFDYYIKQTLDDQGVSQKFKPHHVFIKLGILHSFPSTPDPSTPDPSFLTPISFTSNIL